MNAASAREATKKAILVDILRKAKEGATEYSLGESNTIQEELIDFLKSRGFKLNEIKGSYSLGLCNTVHYTRISVTWF